MWALLSACLLLGGAASSRAEGELPPPGNLTVMALNTWYTMSWDWDQSSAPADNVTFTAQYVAKYRLKMRRRNPSWVTVCGDSPDSSCELTGVSLHYLGIYMLRVRASAGGRDSAWVHREFCPDKDAAVGPPSRVELAPAGSSLVVRLSDPLTSSNTSMKENLPNLYYHLRYWERSAAGQGAFQSLNKSVNMVALPDLKAWTWYCVTVQTCDDFYHKRSSVTPPHCMQTQGAAPWWYVFLCFLGSMLLFFLLVLLPVYISFRCFRTYKATFFPPLPPSLKECLEDSPGRGPRDPPDSDSQLELLCDNLMLCPQPGVLEALAPPEPAADLDPDSSGRHSRQDSSTSGDSGVYSAGGSSSVLLPNINQCFTTKEEGWKPPPPPGQLCPTDADRCWEMSIMAAGPVSS